jgi:hypothetical protein
VGMVVVVMVKRIIKIRALVMPFIPGVFVAIHGQLIVHFPDPFGVECNMVSIDWGFRNPHHRNVVMFPLRRISRSMKKSLELEGAAIPAL